MKTLYALLIIIAALINEWTRIQFVELMVSIYEKETGKEFVLSGKCPFTDVESDSAACKAWELKITSGTTETTFSPKLTVEPYQAFLFIGRTMYALELSK